MYFICTHTRLDKIRWLKRITGLSGEGQKAKKQNKMICHLLVSWKMVLRSQVPFIYWPPVQCAPQSTGSDFEIQLLGDSEWYVGLTLAAQEMSADHWNQWDSSSSDHEYLFNMSSQSIRQLLRHLKRRTGRPTLPSIKSRADERISEPRQCINVY